MLRISLPFALLCALLTACESRQVPAPERTPTPTIENAAVDEVSGMQSSRSEPGIWFVHNDDGPPRVYAMGPGGEDRGSFLVEGAVNRDWEDITGLSHAGENYLVISDTGDNFAKREFVTLYFLREPLPGEDGRYSGSQPLHHSLHLRYPDGARDCESLAYDAAGQQLLLLSKRDTPPRLYGIDLGTAWSAQDMQLEYLGEAHRFRPPTPGDMREFGSRDGRWVSQPTGMDISPDGTLAAIISYRSLYLFERRPDQSWAQALKGNPTEYEGPPAHKEESIGFSRDGRFLLMSSEGSPAPIFRKELEQSR